MLTSAATVIASMLVAGGIGRGEVNITLLPLETGAAALDGSPYGFFFVPSTTSTRWTISIEGQRLVQRDMLALHAMH